MKMVDWANLVQLLACVVGLVLIFTSHFLLGASIGIAGFIIMLAKWFWMYKHPEQNYYRGY